MRLRTFAALALASVLAIGCGGTDSADTSGPVLKWSAIPDADTDLLREKYNPVSEYLSEQLGVAVEYVPVAKYDAAVSAFTNGDIQLAWFGGLTGVQARHAVPGARAIAQGDKDPQYKSYFVAHPSTGIEPSKEFPKELANHPFTFGSESSTSGRLMPEFFIRENTGKTPQAFFENGFAFSGKHDLTAKQVEEGGAVKCGVLSFAKWESMVAGGDLDPKLCRIVWTTPFYADYNFTSHPGLDETYGAGFTDKLQKALIDLKDKKLLGAFLRDAFIPAKNEDFSAIQETARQLELIRD